MHRTPSWFARMTSILVGVSIYLFVVQRRVTSYQL